MQELVGTSLVSTFDLSLISTLGWDLGSTTLLSVLGVDPAYLDVPAPLSMVPNCDALNATLAPFRAAAGLDGAAEGPSGVLDGLLQNCASVALKEVANTAEIDDELYCTFPDNTVCALSQSPCCLPRLCRSGVDESAAVPAF